MGLKILNIDEEVAARKVSDVGGSKSIHLVCVPPNTP